MSNLVFLLREVAQHGEKGELPSCSLYLLSWFHITNPNHTQTSTYETSIHLVRFSDTDVKCCLVWKIHRIRVLDPSSVRARDSVWTRNLHPRQQSGFHHRVKAVKPLLTGWCGSQRLVKCNVPQDLILAVTLLHRGLVFFFISMSFLLLLHPLLNFHCLPRPSPLLSTVGAVKPSETTAVVLRQVFLARRCLHAKCKLWWNPLLHDLICC